MDNTNVSDRCIVRIIRANNNIETKTIEETEQAVSFLKNILEILALLNKQEKGEIK